MEILWSLVFVIIPLIIMIVSIYWLEKRKIMKATLQRDENYIYPSVVQKEEFVLLKE